MKKIVYLISFILLCTSVQAEGDRFVDALRNCSPFQDSDTINVNGINAKSNKQMLGWQNGKCSYKESISFGTSNIVTSCSFSRPQIDEIVSVADAYYTTLKYSNEKVDLSSTDAVKNNPVVNVLNKYLQDPSVCSVGGLE